MWEAMMLLRLIASVSPRRSIGPKFPIDDAGRGLPTALPVDTLKGAIRLSFAAWRLSLPLSESNSHHDRKTA
ncbi:hypothetical protein OOJ09_26785 [Mesorhizobium qingshengii]|uniref:Uncharacterized protein n=1 Tax=Mesorhizobium qingshengii TaxID=1165689 RepID=A0ABT4R1V1_9HYPH|nr:hypothetical protein [Mesorhizobium qingshengii]MCZ8547806.1 hypothetical protein [Mesorhizobium qingshengii]